MAAPCLPRLRSVDAGGRRIAWRAAGGGETLLALHGIGSGSASWAAQLSGLADRFRVVAWDMPGYGGSEPLPDVAPTAAAYGAAASALLDALGIGRVHVLGHSLGALIAASLCRAAPDRPLSVILANPAAGYARAPDEIRVGRLRARLAAMATQGPAEVARLRARELLSASAPDEVYERVRAVQSKVRPEGYAQAARMLHGADIHDDAALIAVPALVMCGSADRVTPEESCRRIAAAIPGAAYRPLEGAGHASYVERPTQFNSAVAGFIAALRGGDSPAAA